MNQALQSPRGLTRIILDTLISITPDVLEAGESWTPNLLDRVESYLRTSLGPRDNRRNELLFNLVFHRSFAEAKTLMLHLAGSPPSRRKRRGPPRFQVDWI